MGFFLVLAIFDFFIQLRFCFQCRGSPEPSLSIFLCVCVCLQDLLPWVSGEHGFIVFTLGTMVSEMPEELTSVFIEAFRQIPQKVPDY